MKVLALSFTAMLSSVAAPAAAAAPRAIHETVRPLAREPLPNVPGKVLISVEVDFPPGAAAVAHRHPPSAFVYAYVLSGEIVSALGERKPRIYRAGESWSEAPGALHRVSRNPSSARPARLLVIFIADAGEDRLVRPVTGR
jgi:quercetin dioxygenase-like cupin family protein